MKRIFIVIGIFLLLGCEKEKIVEKLIEKEYAWTLHPNPDLKANQAILLNSYATEDYFFAVGYNTFTSMVSDSLVHPDAFGNNSNMVTYGSHRGVLSETKILIDDDFFAYQSVYGALVIHPNLNPITSGTWTYLRMEDIDSTFKRFYYVPSSLGNGLVVNDKKQLLVPYVGKQATPTLLLLDLKPNTDDLRLVRIDTSRTQKITIPRVSHAILPGSFHSIGNNFYFSFYHTYRLNSNGEIKVVLDNISISDFVKDGANIYGIGYGKLYKSIDDGINWSEVQNLQAYDFELMDYSKVGDKIIAYYKYGQIFELTFGPTGIEQSRELENDGLQGKYITSVTEFQGKVYVTTYSGLYYRNIDDFFKDKKKDK
ncbi:hypothetical protein BKI52_16900 [marine bacterium AO1-C]|nr:hypothetical protein BKI52_16900 [marine bacterium AO1-C]